MEPNLAKCTIGGLIIDPPHTSTEAENFFNTRESEKEEKRDLCAGGVPLLSCDMRMQLGSRAIHGGIKLKPTLDEILCRRAGI
jgi:hypothetical protein